MSFLHISCASLGEEIHLLGTGHGVAGFFTPALRRTGKIEVCSA